MSSFTELCSICFANLPKYTCPRCGCQTCSLGCVKTHKRRAKCSGVRDPASYLKASELATPASIDNDYNFLTKVQRDIERAEDDVADRGITFVPAQISKTTHAGKSKLELECEACGVSIVRAPTGLARSKQNKTHWDNRHKCIMWTVEWVLQDGRRVHANVKGGRTVLDAFTNAVGRKGLQRKRKLEEDPRRQEERQAKPTDMRTQQAATEQSDGGQPIDHSRPAEAKEIEEVHRSPGVVPASTVENTASQMHFYLHRPRTSSKWTCLIPIAPLVSISDMLKYRTILEYPTIYALHDAEDHLVAPLITEKDYEENNGVDVLPRLPIYSKEEATTAVDAIPDYIDEGEVMEVLRKDLVG